MSLDSLFQHILQTEQQLSEKTRQFQEAKMAISRCQEQVRTSTRRLRRLAQDQDQKAQQVSEWKLQCDLMEKRLEEMLRQKVELVRQQSALREALEKMKQESKEELERFMREIRTFNSSFSLLSNRQMQLQSQQQSEVRQLDTEGHTINTEMESMQQRNSGLSSMQEEKRGLHLELLGMENILKDLERQLEEARATTETLRDESDMVSQKPLTDSTCLRLKKELKLLREALSSETHFLQTEYMSKNKVMLSLKQDVFLVETVSEEPEPPVLQRFLIVVQLVPGRGRFRGSGCFTSKQLHQRRS